MPSARGWFYEWQKIAGGKQPIYIRMQEGRQFAFGGLWERWSEGERPVESFCIITVEPNDLCSKVHDRMPLILPEAGFSAWLDPQTSPEDLVAMLRSYCSEEMECYPVSPMVNSPRNENRICIERFTVPRLPSSGRCFRRGRSKSI